jgi:hypothetical protein
VLLRCLTSQADFVLTFLGASPIQAHLISALQKWIKGKAAGSAASNCANADVVAIEPTGAFVTGMEALSYRHRYGIRCAAERTRFAVLHLHF